MSTTSTPAQELTPDPSGAASRTDRVAATFASTHSESETNVNDLNPAGAGAKDVGPEPAPAATTWPDAGDISPPAWSGAAEPAIPTSRPTATAPAVEADKAGFRDRLAGRVLVVAGKGDAAPFAELISETESGLVLCGKGALDALKQLSDAYVSLPMAIDPWQSYAAHATVKRPFNIDGLATGNARGAKAATLERFLVAQISAGAEFAVSPTGIQFAGDTRPLKEAVEVMNEIKRDDVVLHVPLETAWFAKENLHSLKGILAHSKHPVAITVVDRNRDPYSKFLPQLRELVAALEYAIVWRVDFAGLDLMAHGAKACAIGAIPSHRGVTLTDGPRHSSDKSNHFPHVLLPDYLRWVRANHMRVKWFARIQPLKCACVVCGGAAVDRFSASDDDRFEAHRHNVAVLMVLIENAPSLVGAKVMWSQMVAQAIVEHASLGRYIGGQVDVPPELKAYSAD